MSNFYINRLKTFSIAEFPYRIKQMIVKQLEEKFYQNKIARPLPLVPVLRILQPGFGKVLQRDQAVDRVEIHLLLVQWYLVRFDLILPFV